MQKKIIENSIKKIKRRWNQREEKIEIAKNLLKNRVDISIIVDSTGLTEEEIDSLMI